MDYIKIVINSNLVNKNIDELLSLSHLSKDKKKEYLNKEILINDKVLDEDYFFKLNDIVLIPVNEEIDLVPKVGKLDIIYEDDYVLLINKPRGMLVHPDGNNKVDTLSNLVAYYFKEHNIHRKIRNCHRLDIDTGGLILFSKDDLSCAYYSYLISEHLIERKYLGLLEGKLNQKELRLVTKIGRDRHVSNKYRVSTSPSSKEAITNLKLIKYIKNYSLVEFLLETGRTHQIRVHSVYLNHPLVGDKIYGRGRENDKLMLFSYSIKFNYFLDNKILEFKIKDKELDKYD